MFLFGLCSNLQQLPGLSLAFFSARQRWISPISFLCQLLESKFSPGHSEHVHMIQTHRCRSKIVSSELHSINVGSIERVFIFQPPVIFLKPQRKMHSTDSLALVAKLTEGLPPEQEAWFWIFFCSPWKRKRLTDRPIILQENKSGHPNFQTLSFTK